ncbi:endonuclease VII domain-containing protein [Stutzerimonas stutzeri]|uniref:endonuclease VII domain-containing protein n=1 Tax=Stutzerimonas stutzeri TaxID=316 RepID=UPI0009BDF2E6|nr:endonuclease VII domain-containing protein [Stutzerimonas stutzeri]
MSLAETAIKVESASTPMCEKHPDRRAKARGMCNSCYVTNRYHSLPEERAKKDATATAWRLANPERARAIKQKSRGKACPIKKRDAMYRRKYGITVDNYEQMYAEQSGLCAICHQPPAAGKLLHVDHCHASGVVRGLLCHQCNWYLGKVDSIPGLLGRLSAYVEGAK